MLSFGLHFRRERQFSRQSVDGETNAHRKSWRLRPYRMAIDDQARVVAEHLNERPAADALADQPAREPGEAEASARRVGDRFESVKTQSRPRSDFQRPLSLARESPGEDSAILPE